MRQTFPRILTIPALAGLALTACGEPEDTDSELVPLALTARAHVDGAPVDCDTSYTLGTAETQARIADARLFLSGLQVRAPGGEWRDLGLEQDGPWQHEGVVLLDFEDGTGACADSGTTERNDAILALAPEGAWEALRFQVGLPFALNHLDNATAPAPLNTPGMFWAWQGGYKFIRVDFATGEGRWNVHLGSTGCVSDGPTIPPEGPCGRPNQPTIEVPLSADGGFDIDLAALVADADLATNAPDTPPGCMSNPMESGDCTPVFEALGLDFETGSCVDDCVGQEVFQGVE
jgi:uncharacterized repeat protein (TIGR04052 family)